MQKKKQRAKFGNLPRMYNFSLNPYPELKFNSCPHCEKKTGQRTLPLIIRIKPAQFVVMNYKNRYCKHCDSLIAHKHEIEEYLVSTFSKNVPEIIGNEYLVFGSIEKKMWQESKKNPAKSFDIREHAHDFKSYEEIRMTMGGWFKKGTTPPVMKPPASEYWVKK